VSRDIAMRFYRYKIVIGPSRPIGQHPAFNIPPDRSKALNLGCRYNQS
jgi:hypothetical protein